MAIDIRAIVTCSLGTLISGSITDGYIQGNGLILVNGSVEISGLITPAVGTAVTFTYKINGGTRNIPRKLRVLSSFADPFRRTTKVELGCKLTYLSDLREQIKWSAYDDPENATDYAPSDFDVIPIPVRASSMMSRCLTALGITASSNPLTNRFSAGQYDFSSGWVNVLGQLLVSEGYCGYLNRNEVLQIFALNQEGGTGPVVTKDELIDIGAINSGQLPGEAVVVSYTTQRLKEEAEPIDWTQSNISNRSTVALSYRSPITGNQLTASYEVLETAAEITEFQELTKASTGEKVNVVRYRKTERTESSAKAIGQIMIQYLEAGASPASAQLLTVTEEWFFYDEEAQEIKSIRETYASKAYAYGAASVPMVFNIDGINSFVSIPFGYTYFKEGEEVETFRVGNLSKIITREYGNWIDTIEGQQAIAEGRASFTSSAEVDSYMNSILRGKFLKRQSVQMVENASSTQRVPSGNSYRNQQYSKDAGRKTSKSELALALGSATAQRRIEFALPMSPDDYFVKVGGSYALVANAAETRAKAFGIIQNRLLLGNRNGMNIRLSALNMPEAPFSPLVVNANGVAALYRTNATTWTFSNEGLIVSADALFWGAVGGSGSFWFPVAPGVTSLPSLPATSTVNVTGTDDNSQTVVVGTQNVLTASGVVAPYNETHILAPSVRVGLLVSSLSYALNASTAVSVVTRAVILAPRVRLVELPAADITVAAITPLISTGAAVRPPIATVSINALTPLISSGASVAPTSAVIVTEVLVPQQIGKQKTQVFIGVADVAVAAATPGVASGASIASPQVDIAIAASVPTGIGAFDPNFSNVSLLLHMDGSDNSTTFTDSSSNTFSVTAVGNSKISTVQSKFGGASGLFDGSGDYLSIADNSAFTFGAGDFTIECWLYPSNLSSPYGAFGKRVNTGTEIKWINSYVNTNGTIQTQLTTNGTSWLINTSTSSTITSGTWHHIAWVRSGSSFSVYVNGVQNTLTTALSGSIFTDTSALIIGAIGTSGSFVYSLNGYIDDFRITKGVARYGSFTPPTVAHPDSLAGDINFSSVSLLLHMDGSDNSTTFTDNSSNGLTVTRFGNSKISTSQSKFGGASCYLDGSGDYLSLASSAVFGFGTGDFTIEYWTYPTRNTINETFIDTRPSDTGTPLVLGKSSTGAVRCYDGTTIRTGGSMTLNTWHHVAWVRSGSSNTVFLNGVSVITFTNAFDAGSTRTLVIGSNVLTSAENCQGYFDDLRITKGVARYTANFTSPAAAFQNR